MKVDGSEIKLPAYSKIEIVIVDDSDSKESDTSDFRKQHTLAINVNNTK